MNLCNIHFFDLQPVKSTFGLGTTDSIRTNLVLICLFVFGMFAFSTAHAAPGDENWDDAFSLAGFDDVVHQIISDSQGNVYAAGRFTHVDGVVVNGLARWDGTSWTGLGLSFSDLRAKPLSVDENDVLYVSGSFRAGDDTGNGKIYTIASWDGTSWTDLSVGLPGDSGQFTVMGSPSNGIFYAAGSRNINGTTQYGVYSLEGSTWSLIGDEFAAGSGNYIEFSDIAFDSNDNLYVAGLFELVGSTVVNSVATWDGTSWSALGAGITNSLGSQVQPGNVSSIAIDGADELYASGYFEEAGGVSVTGSNIVKWSNGAWTQPFSAATETIFNNREIIIDAVGTLYTAGDTTTPSGTFQSVYFWGGTNWVSAGQQFDTTFDLSPVESLAFASDGTLYAAGSGLSGSSNGVVFNRIARFDGSNWTALTSYSGLGANGEIFDLAQAPNGDVFVVGRFTSIGGKLISRIARWDGSTWSAVSGGNIEPHYASSLVIANSGDVYVGGDFKTTAGLYSNGSVARWNGIEWSLVGANYFGDITDLVFDDNGVLFATGMQYIDNVPINNVASWDGIEWAELGGGVTQPSGFARANALSLTASGDLLLAGQFTKAGGVDAVNVARWNGTNWSAMGTGLEESSNDGVADITETSSGEIFAVGQLVIDAATGESAPLAIWDGTNWSYVNSPTSTYGSGSALSVITQGEIIVAGGFYVSFTPLSEGIAAWDGTQWRGFGSGVFGSRVLSMLALQDGSVLLVGSFSEAGGKPSSNIARWIESTANGFLCNGLPITVDISLAETATSGDDVILGTPGDDTISAFGGNDTICGLGGDDVIFAGNGDDWVDAGAGNDEVQGSNGTDVIFGGEGNDYLAGGPGDDTVYGDEGNDSLFGNRGADTINGGDGVDEIRGGPGDDDIDTGSGATVGSGVYVDGGAGDDTITGGPDADEIRGSTDQDTVIGGDGDDMLYGGSGEDEVRGEDGDDLMRGNAGNDVLTGGSGNDNINGYGSRDTITGGEGDDTLDGSTGNDVIRGEAGDDTIRGGGGNDQLFGDAGVDNLAGGGGNDAMDGGSGAPDVCDGQGGVDTATPSCEDVLNTP